MAQVHIIRHNPGAVFCGTAEVVLVGHDNSIARLVEPSGNVGTQYPGGIGSQWFGTIENLQAGLALGKVPWSDVYKTDVLWTTPSADRDQCDQFKNEFNAVYGAMLQQVTGGPLRSNRMARFTHRAGYPDPDALFEVQIKAATGAGVEIGGGQIDYGSWVDHQPSGASVMHQKDGAMVTTLGPDLVEETRFVFEEQYAAKFAEQGIDFRTQTVWLEVLVGVDDAPEKTWERIEAIRTFCTDYFGDHMPAGLIYPVSRIPNLDGIIEPQPRVVSGDVEISRSGQRADGFSTWTKIRYKGIEEVMVSAVGGDDAAQILGTIDARVQEAGGRGLKEDGVFNNAYIGAGDDMAANAAALQAFNGPFSGYYEGVVPAGRTAQFMGGIQQPGYAYGISNRSIFAA